MIEYLGHNIIKCDSNINDSFNVNHTTKDDEFYLLHKCNKCNKYVYSHPDLSTNHFWMYGNGILRNKIVGDWRWHFLKLTCEEEIIKDMLE